MLLVYWILIKKIKAILKKKVPQMATRLSKISLKKINSTSDWSERLTKMDLPMKVSWVRIPAGDLYSFFVGFSGFYFFPIFKNCLWKFVELFSSKLLLFLWLVSNTLQHTCLSRPITAKIWRCLNSRAKIQLEFEDFTREFWWCLICLNFQIQVEYWPYKKFRLVTT